MARKRTGETALQWVPTVDQSRVLDCLAMGLSQNARAGIQGSPTQPSMRGSTISCSRMRSGKRSSAGRSYSRRI